MVSINTADFVNKELFDQLPSNLQEAKNGAPQRKRPASTYRPLNGHKTSDSTQSHASRNNTLSPLNSNNERKIISSHLNPSPFQSSSVPPDTGQLRNQFAPGIDLDYRRTLQDSYSPSLPNGPGIQTPNTRSSSQLSDTNQPAHNLQNVVTGQNIPDLSGLMFPSADPFVYPIQPMTTLENGQSIKNEDPTSQGMYNLPSLTTSGTCNPYENISGPIYIQSPPILMPRQHSGYLQGMNSSMGMSNGMSTAPSLPIQMDNMGGWHRHQQQQQPFDQLFGEDWGGWINQGYR